MLVGSGQFSAKMLEVTLTSSARLFPRVAIGTPEKKAPKQQPEGWATSHEPLFKQAKKGGLSYPTVYVCELFLVAG